MKKSNSVWILPLCFSLEGVLAFWCLINIYNVNNYPPIATLIGSIAIVWLVNLGIFFLAKKLQPDTLVYWNKNCLCFSFIYYCLIAFYILFLYRLLQRYEDMTPFRTFIRYTTAFIQGQLGWQYIIQQYGLHFLIYAPLGFFIPRLFSYFRSVVRFSLFMVVLLALTSTIMVLRDCGTLVFDYLLLSLFGSLAAYGLCWALPLHRKQQPALAK